MSLQDGPLVAADEWLTHQIVETHARVAQADRSWTEKVCAMAAARDGSLQLAFGLGKYTNRNVLDGYAGVSRGREQWTVRASRRLSDDADQPGCRPVALRRARSRIGACDSAATPTMSCRSRSSGSSRRPFRPKLERRDIQRSRRGYRARRRGAALPPDRRRVGLGRSRRRAHRSYRSRRGSRRATIRGACARMSAYRQPTSKAAGGLPDLSFRFSWSPMLLERADGTRYAIHHQHRRLRVMGYEEQQFEGGVEHADGRVDAFTAVRTGVAVRPRQSARARRHVALHDGRRHVRGRSPSKRSATPASTSAPVSTSGLDGHHHGEWRGALHVDGEHIDDCTTPMPRAACTRSATRCCASSDPVGGGTGWCNFQTTIFGAWPEVGLDESTSFV